MKLATYLSKDGPAVGAVVGSEIIDMSAHFRSMLALIDGGAAALDRARALIDKREKALPLAGARFLSPVPEPRQIRDFNNFEQHMRDAPLGMARLKARLAGAPQPDPASPRPAIADVNFTQPIFYISNRFNVVGHDAEIEVPSYSKWFDYEAEFGVFLGSKGRNISKARAREHIFGFAVFNDFSARDKQAREMEGWLGPTKGKSFDTGNAIGPWIVTADEIADERALNVIVRINGEVCGRNSTAAMIHSFADMIAYISQDETLYPGEFLGSGTVGGCCALESGHWLKPGDVIEVEFDRIGTLRNRVVQRSA
jgi:2-keto-4-pentenoate hydratase/2-oxohepta-3-ene-1,7-dioic acid hydratase in catechol pathway